MEGMKVVIVKDIALALREFPDLHLNCELKEISEVKARSSKCIRNSRVQFLSSNARTRRQKSNMDALQS